MRLLLISDLADTGFGRVGRELATGLLGRGWDVRVIGINYRGLVAELAALAQRLGGDRDALRTATEQLTDHPLFDRVIPAGEHGDGSGRNLTAPAIRGTLWPEWTPERVLVVADPRAMMDKLANDAGSLGALGPGAVFNYVPIEGQGLPAVFGAIWERVTAVAMSDFGGAQLEALLGRPVPIIHHGVSTAFRPLSPRDPGTWKGRSIQTKDAAKAAIGLAGRTIILRTDRYILRKNYPAFFRVLRPVFASHPEVLALVHTVTGDDIGWGDIRELITREPGIIHDGPGYYAWHHPQIFFTGAHDSFKGLTDEEMRVLYGAADLYVSPTMAEGFGLTLAESLACGVPVVATDYSAIREVVGPGGALIPVDRLFTNPYHHEWALVDEAAMSAAVERLISKPRLRASLGAEGRRHVARFTWSNAVEQFDRLLQIEAA